MIPSIFLMHRSISTISLVRTLSFTILVVAVAFSVYAIDNSESGENFDFKRNPAGVLVYSRNYVIFDSVYKCNFIWNISCRKI